MTTFLDVVELLLTDGDAKAAYSADPGGFLDEHGLGDLDSADVADAMLYATDSLPLPVATQLDAGAGLDSAAALDLGAEGLSLEREAYDSAGDLVEDGADDSALGEDVEFDVSPEVEAADASDAASIDAVDLLDAPSPWRDWREIARRALSTLSHHQRMRPPLPTNPQHPEVSVDDDDITDDGDDLTDFIPVEDAVVETPEDRLDADIDDLDAADLLDTTTDDLDFLD